MRKAGPGTAILTWCKQNVNSIKRTIFYILIGGSPHFGRHFCVLCMLFGQLRKLNGCVVSIMLLRLICMESQLDRVVLYANVTNETEGEGAIDRDVVTPLADIFCKNILIVGRRICVFFVFPWNIHRLEWWVPCRAWNAPILWLSAHNVNGDLILERGLGVGWKGPVRCAGGRARLAWRDRVWSLGMLLLCF